MAEKRACRNCYWGKPSLCAPAQVYCNNPDRMKAGDVVLSHYDCHVCEKHRFPYNDPKETPMSATEFVLVPDPLVAPVEMTLADVPENSAFAGTVGEFTGLFVKADPTVMVLTGDGDGRVIVLTEPSLTVRNYRHVKRLAMSVEY